MDSSWDLPGFDFADLNTPLQTCVRHYRERLAARMSWFSAASSFWELMQGFFLGAESAYGATRILVSEDRERPFPVQAAAVARTSIEIVGSVLCLAEAQDRWSLFWQDAFRDGQQGLARIQAIPHVAADARYQAWMQGSRHEMDQLADRLNLSPQERADPVNQLRPWPTVTKIRDRSDANGRPYVSGTRRDVLGELLDLWYGPHSRLAHQLSHGIVNHLYLWQPTDPRRAIHMRTDVVLCAALGLACVMSELELVGQWPQPRPPALATAWEALSTLTPSAGRIHQLRYQ